MVPLEKRICKVCTINGNWCVCESLKPEKGLYLLGEAYRNGGRLGRLTRGLELGHGAGS